MSILDRNVFIEQREFLFRFNVIF